MKRLITPATLDLINAKARIEDEENWWCEGKGSNFAGLLCAAWALDESNSWHREAGDFLRQAAKELFGVGPIEVNDDLGHPAVMRMYDRAIELSMEG